MNDVVSRMREQIDDAVYPDTVPLLREALSLISEMSAALSPFARKAKALDWRKGSTYRDHTSGESFSDDQAKVLLDTIEVAKATAKQLSIGDFRRARDVWEKVNAMKASDHGRSP
jgi:hypothetical protein